jgi:hypothetical protein
MTDNIMDTKLDKKSDKSLGDLLKASQAKEPLDVEEWERCIERIRDVCGEWLAGWAEDKLKEIQEVSDALVS